MGLYEKKEKRLPIGGRVRESVKLSVADIAAEYGDHVKPANIIETFIEEGVKRHFAKSKKPANALSTKSTSQSKLNLDKWPYAPTPELLTDWYRAKKSAGGSVSQRAINGVGDELHKAVAKGFTVEECLTQAEGNKWKGFKAEWMKREEVSTEVQADFVGTHTDKSWADGL